MNAVCGDTESASSQLLDATVGEFSAPVQNAQLFQRGESVKLEGLQSAADLCLNGKIGTVVEFDAASQRYKVKVAGFHVPKAIHAKNVVAAEQPDTPVIIAEESELGGCFKINDLVWIQGLTSDAALPLNGQCCKIVSFNKSTGRFGVEVHGGFGLKAIRPDNLRHGEGAAVPIEELSAQTAIEQSMLEASASREAGAVNAQVSEALVRTSPAAAGLQVLLLKFSRASAAMREVLLKAHDLAICRAALEDESLPIELGSGAMILTRPENHGPALTAVRLRGLTLHKNHVLVDVDLEDIVKRLVQQLRGRSFTYPMRRDVLPISLAASAASWGDLGIKRTFIEIRVPNSMRSESEPGAARTASTTDADPRKCGSGRAARRGGSGRAGS